MTQLIDLIEDISIFNETDNPRYYSSSRSFRQIDKSTIEAICHIHRRIDDFTIKTNLGDVTIKDVSVSYDRIYEIRFLSVDVINKIYECTCESSIDTNSIEAYAFDCDKKYRNELTRQVVQELAFLSDSEQRSNNLNKVFVKFNDLEFIEDSSEVIKIK